MSLHGQETSLIDYEDFMDQHDQDTRLIDPEDVMEVGLQDFVRKLNLQPTNATITPDKLKHGHHLIEAFESGLDDSIEPLDRLRKLHLSGEARHLLDMDLTKDHDVIPDWLMFPQADKEQYDGIPDWANGTEVNPMPTTLRQEHLHHELVKYLRCGKPTLAVIMRIGEMVEREGMEDSDDEYQRAFMITAAVRDALRVDLKPEHRKFSMLLLKQREYAEEMKKGKAGATNEWSRGCSAGEG